MSRILEGQTAIVTGSGRGIGRAIALQLARAGAAVAVTARTRSEIEETADMIRGEGGCAIAVAADVTSPSEIGALADTANHLLGPVTLLVNNAAHTSNAARLWEADADEWWRCIEVNLRGPFVCIRAVLPAMLERGEGRIINISSRSAGIASPGRSEYASSKAALVRLTDTLAAELEGSGVSVFAVHPGRVPTAASIRFLASEVGQQWMETAGATLCAMEAPPERCAELCELLASGVADGLSGCFLSVFDDVADLARRSEEVRRDDSYMLRLKK
jgi:NAD(P)-dependent dehydrogenase (short-subunit alcohol dehydrogenase family)